MVVQQRGNGRTNALHGELSVRVAETGKARVEDVYDLLAEIDSHTQWAGSMQPKKNFRLLSVDAPQGPASVGTEFRSTGTDPMGSFADSSVVTEATRPSVFEFVTEARLTTKTGKVVEWTNVHRYELASHGEGCRISYTIRMVRISELPGALAIFRIPGLRSLGLWMSGSAARRGLRNLIRLTAERERARGKDEGR